MLWKKCVTRKQNGPIVYFKKKPNKQEDVGMKRVWERWRGYVADEGAFSRYCTELVVNMCRDVFREESKLLTAARNVAVNVFSCKMIQWRRPETLCQQGELSACCKK